MLDFARKITYRQNYVQNMNTSLNVISFCLYERVSLLFCNILHVLKSYWILLCLYYYLPVLLGQSQYYSQGHDLSINDGMSSKPLVEWTKTFPEYIKKTWVYLYVSLQTASWFKTTVLLSCTCAYLIWNQSFFCLWSFSNRFNFTLLNSSGCLHALASFLSCIVLTNKMGNLKDRVSF